MLTFAITTSTKLASISLFEDDIMIGSININVIKTHSTTIVDQVKKLFEWTGKDINEVNTVILSKGPGSFTGVRIAMALIKGMYSMSNNVELYTVCELDALYYMAKDLAPIIVSGIDSRKGKIYYNVHINGIKEVEDSIGNIYEVIEDMKKYDMPIVYSGDIVNNYKNDIAHDKLVKTNKNMLLIDSRVYYDMYKNGLLEKEDLASVVPYYLEKSQAEKDYKGE